MGSLLLYFLSNFIMLITMYFTDFFEDETKIYRLRMSVTILLIGLPCILAALFLCIGEQLKGFIDAHRRNNKH